MVRTEVSNGKEKYERDVKNNGAFSEVSSNVPSNRSTLNPGQLTERKGKKISEKKENIKIYHDEGSKMT